MKRISQRSFGAMVVTALGLWLAVGLGQTTVVAQGPGGAGPRIEDEFMNIKSMRGQPADQLIPTMVLFEAALGVGCPYCHDPDAAKRDADTNPRKDVARRMMEMVATVNKTTFGGAHAVTCFTCHSGRAVPIGTANVTGEELPHALGEDYIASLPPAPSVPSITPAQLFDKYLAAAGGAAAFQKSPTLTAVGTVTQRRPGRDFPSNQIEISSKAPGLQLLMTRAGQNENLLASGASAGWAKPGNGAPRELRKAEGDAMRLEDAFNLPMQLKQMMMNPQVGRPEVIDNRELYVITGRTQNLPMVKAYFDKESGMLARLVYSIDTPYGPYPTQVEYGDYRDVGGRRVPHKWMIAQVRNREFTYVLQQVRAAAVDDAKFARPTASTR